MPSYPSLPINAIVSGYTEAFNWLSRATSRDITVIVEPMKSGCPNSSGFDIVTQRAFPVWASGNPFSSTVATVIPSFGISGVLNVPFSGGEKCPVCDDAGFVYSPTSGTVSARIQWRNEDTSLNLERVKLEKEEFDVRIKVTGDAAINLLDRSIRVVIDGKDCRILQKRVPFGLREVFGYYYHLEQLP